MSRRDLDQYVTRVRVDPTEPTSRLRVQLRPDDDIMLVHEYELAAGGRHVDSKLWLDPDDARWLHAALGEFLELLGAS